MPKKIKYESFIYQFLVASRKLGDTLEENKRVEWQAFTNHLKFCYQNGFVEISWDLPQKGSIATKLNRSEITLYTRGDTDRAVYNQMEKNDEQPITYDSVKLANSKVFFGLAKQVAADTGFII